MQTPINDERHSLIEAGCAFWFNDSEQVRSPFPKEIHDELRQRSTDEYEKWLENLTEKDRGEVDNDELVSVFEMFLFREAIQMVDQENEDLLLTIHHPFMPRIGDMVDDEENGPSRVLERRIGDGGDKKPHFILVMQNVESEVTWETDFLLPP